MMMQPQIILLKEGTDTSQGRGQVISNINACQALMDTIRSTLGPCGMDKLLHDGRKTTISNDGATIMQLLDIVHPAAKTLVDISLSQDVEVGDGTTSVVLLAAEFLRLAKPFIEENMHPQSIIKGYRHACQLALAKIKEIEIKIENNKKNEMLKNIATTSLNSKLIATHKDFFANIVIQAVECLEQKNLDVNLIGIKKVPGGSLTESFLVKGVAFKKTFSYAGFEQQPKTFENPKILLLNVELELKNEKENAEIRIQDPVEYQNIVDAEWSIIYEKLQKCVDSGAQIVLSKLPVGDLATQYFADRNIFCAGRVANEDMIRTMQATGALIQTSVHDIKDEVLGRCGKFQELQLGNERYNLFTECQNTKTSTIILRGGAEQFIEETERSIHDAIMVVKRTIQSETIVPGGGAIEMQISKRLREHAKTIQGKEQLFMIAYAKSFEIIPKQLCENAGYDSTDILNLLRQKHYRGEAEGKYFGVDLQKGTICNTYEKLIWEPAANKMNSIASATEAACLILSIDETVRNPKSEQPAPGPAAGGRGGPISAGMGGQGMKSMAMKQGLGKGVRAFKGKGGA